MAQSRLTSSFLLALLLCSPGLLFGPAPLSATALQRTRAVRVKELTDATFEHDTQAASGQTTGRWLVIFVGEELDQKALDNPTEELGDDREEPHGESQLASGGGLSSMELIHSIMVIASEQSPREFIPALVHVEKSPALKKRFNITSTPTVKLFRDRKVYSFAGAPRSTQELRHFLEVGFSGLPAEDVPREPSFWERLVEDMPSKYKVFKKRIEERPWLLPIVGLSITVLFYSLTAKLLGLGKRSAQRASRVMQKSPPASSRAVKRD